LETVEQHKRPLMVQKLAKLVLVVLVLQHWSLASQLEAMGLFFTIAAAFAATSARFLAK
jgi:hypothetical protein